MFVLIKDKTFNGSLCVCQTHYKWYWRWQILLYVYLHPHLCDIIAVHAMCSLESLSDLGWLFKCVFFHLFNLWFIHSVIVMADPTGAQNWRYGSEDDKTWFICPKSLELHWAIIQPWECDADECSEGEVNCSLSTKQLSPANSQTRVLSRMCLQR